MSLSTAIAMMLMAMTSAMEQPADAEDQYRLDQELRDAADSGRVDEIRELLARGADPTACPQYKVCRDCLQPAYDRQALARAVVGGHSGAVKELLKSPMWQIKRQGDEDQKEEIQNAEGDALCRAASLPDTECSMEILQMLIEHGVDVNTFDYFSYRPSHYTALTKAESHRSQKLSMMLLDAGADITLGHHSYRSRPERYPSAWPYAQELASRALMQADARDLLVRDLLAECLPTGVTGHCEEFLTGDAADAWRKVEESGEHTRQYIKQRDQKRRTHAQRIRRALRTEQIRQAVYTLKRDARQAQLKESRRSQMEKDSREQRAIIAARQLMHDSNTSRCERQSSSASFHTCRSTSSDFEDL